MEDLVTNEQRRINALRLYDVLDTIEEQEFDDIARLAAEICKTSIALISFVDEERQWFKSKVGLGVAETPREFSFCAHAIESDNVFEIQNATDDSRFADNPLVTGHPHIRFYAGAPLITSEGYRLGTLCVIDAQPATISAEQKEALRILARSVVSMLELRRQKLEAELFKQALAETAIVSIYDASLRYEYANDKFCRLAGLTEEEITKMTLPELALADITDEQLNDMLDTVRSGRIFSARVRNLSRNGAVSWSNLIMVPFVNKEGEMVKVVSIRHDVSSEVKMLERLEEAEEIAKVGNWEIDMLSGERYWSKGLLRLMDFDGMPDEKPSLLNMVAPNDKARLEADLSSALGGSAVAGASEFKAITQAGRVVDIVVLSKKRMNSKGQLTALYGTVQDVSAEHEKDARIAESEAKYRSLVENSSQMTYTTDVEGAYTYASVRLKKTIGYEDEEIIGKKFAFIYDDEWRKKTIAFYVAQLESQVEETKYVFPILSKDGDKLWVEQTAMLVREHGKITGFRCVLHDVTHRVQSELAMEEAMKLANEARETQQNFLSRMSHEIRTPMNGVVGMANLLSATALDARQREFVDNIQESAQNMLRIINDILDIAKIEAGKLTFEETDVDVRHIIENVVFNLKPAADDKGIILASSVDSKIPGNLLADPVRLKQVLLNLAGNAIKFTERGSVILSVSPAVISADSATLIFRVIDTGIGIAKDKLDKIFDSFTQAENDTTRKYGGTGLGLTIARQIVEQQGGKLSVESKEGEGTTFAFTFSFRVGTQKPEFTADLTPKANLYSFEGKHILLVEDNIMNQRVARFTLKNWGAKVTIADRGFKALDVMRMQKFDLVLMDLQMPEMSGIQTTIRIRKELHDYTPIMAMTASAMSSEREKCLAAGMNDYISKPFDPAMLNAKMYELIFKPGAQHDVDVIDVNFVLELAGRDRAFAREILDLYINKAPESLRDIDKYLASGEYELLHGEIHNLKNSIGILGAKELFDMLATAEMDTFRKQPSDETLHMLSGVMRDKVMATVEEAKQKAGAL